MGDRNNPIKFGPEWMRNFSREGSSGNNNSSAGSGGAAGGGTGGPPTASGNTNNAPSSQHPKVQLAKLRYGREEMLALYDRSVEPPAEIKYFDLLYNPRGKPPLALNANYEEDMRETMRGGPPIGGLSAPGERFGMGRGAPPPEGRGRGRLPFVRPTSISNRGFTKPGMSGALGYTERGEEAAFDGLPMLNRAWSTSNGTSPSNRNGLENSAEWNQNTNKVFRSRWQGTSTNWRRSTSAREEGEEWRSSESNRPRTMQQQDKWDRDWGERGNRSKSGQSWGNNRPWAGDTPTSDDNLPEWAFDNMEACGGTFDSQGAFHGYSNDDSNLPKAQGDPLYPLTRSHTQGSFTRSKTIEEGSEEWWASEKAKKLSPKRFDANDIKFKKPPPTTEPNASSSGATTSTEDPSRYEPPELLEKEPEPTKELGDKRFAKKSKNPFMFKQKLTESKTFDALMRSDINQEEASDERGNFKSVMINANNGLRQKHQNIVATAVDTPNRQNSPSPVHSRYTPSERDTDGKQTQKLVDDFVEFTFEEKELSPHEIQNIPLPPKTKPSHSITGAILMNAPPPSNPGLKLGLNSISNQGLPKQGMQNQSSAIPHQTQSSIGMPQNQPSLGMPLDPGNSSLGMPSPSLPLTSMPPPNISTTGMSNAGIQSPTRPSARTLLIAGPNMGSMLSANAANGTTSSLFGMGQNQNTSQQLPSSGELHRQPVVSQTSQASMFPMHLQNQSSQNFRSSLYGNLLQQPPPPAPLPDQWFYEDPKKNIQGPFSSKDMFNWYRAGFFTSSLMVRRACDAHMRPLGSYGPVVPFAMDVLSSSFPMSSGYDPRPQGPRDSMMNTQQSLGIGDVMNMGSQEPTLDSLQFGSVGNNFIRNAASAAFGQQPMVDSLWSQPSSSSEMMWMQQGMATRNEPMVNNLPMYFWDQQATPMSNKLLPEEIAKEMKTEEQILAQLRAQNINATFQPVQPTALNKSDEGTRATPDLGELEKLIHKDTLNVAGAIACNIVAPENNVDIQPIQAASEKNKSDSAEDLNISNTNVKSSPVQKAAENKQTKQKESEKTAKNKENNTTKTKKKPKDDKKDEGSDAKSKEEDFYKSEKKSEESSPSKTKKEDKQSKKDLEKEKKEWIKEGFTIVKGPEKTTNKDSKKKVEEVKAAEEAERKRKEEEKVMAEEEKRRKQAEALKNKQDQAQTTRANIELVSKKAPWSAVLNPSQQATDRDGLTLAEIQRLEREKKLEQIKQQQALMQLLARQQIQQREQEMQASLGWAKNKVASTKNIPGKSLGEIQAEARRQQAAAAAAAAAAATALEEELTAAQLMPPPPAPWTNTHNGGGFWDTERINQISQKTVEKPQEPPKPVEPKPKKKQPQQQQPVPAPSNNKESSPALEFEAWCSNVLNLWSSKIDVPTFIGFLKDIESPFEVKEYVKCYLGESKDSNDFSRQFLERRCKLLRVGTVTPSDDLCSPAAAVNPRAAAASEYQEGKGKKSKKNKMLKVDARILGFSVTASEDRINVGDIDTV